MLELWGGAARRRLKRQFKLQGGYFLLEGFQLRVRLGFEILGCRAFRGLCTVHCFLKFKSLGCLGGVAGASAKGFKQLAAWLPQKSYMFKKLLLLLIIIINYYYYYYRNAP